MEILSRINYKSSLSETYVEKHTWETERMQIYSTTLICPSTPVAAATILVSPFGILRNSFEAYALELVSDL